MSVQGGPDIVTDGLIMHLDAANNRSYPGSGTLWGDLSGNGNLMGIETGTTFNSANGGNFILNGINARLAAGYSNSINSTTNFVSISSWFKFNALPSSEVAIIDRANSWRLGFVPGAARCLVKTLGGIDGWTGANDFAYSFLTNTWYHITMTYDGSNMRIYLNSELTKTATVTGTIKTDTSYTFMGFVSSPMNGNIATCLVYNTALSTKEIRQNYHATKGRYGLF
jgi:hypothetical protein